MKKVLILMLVLGMASWANATEMNLTLSTSDAYTGVTPGTVITVKLTTDQTVQNWEGIDFVATGDTGGTNALSIGAGGWLVGDPGSSNNGTESGGDILGAQMGVEFGYEYLAGTVLYSFSATINEDGHIGMADVSCMKPGTMPPQYYEIGELNGLDVTIPEPMTIALLGLGGLFLRRRK